MAIETEALVGLCPFYTSDLGYTNRKAQIDKQAAEITKIINQSLESQVLLELPSVA